MVKVIKKAEPRRRKSPSSKQRRMSPGEFIFRAILVLAALMLFISYLSVYVSPRIFWVPFFFGLYYIPLALINLLLLLVALFRRSAAFLIPALALLPSIFFAEEFVKFGKDPAEPSADCISIMTYNVGRYVAGSEPSGKAGNQESLKNFMASENPDVVCLQEFYIDDTLNLSRVLPDYPYHYSHLYRSDGGFSGNLTLSRFPIVGGESFNFSGSSNMFISTDIEVGARILRIFNCHLESYGISFTSLIKKLSDKEYFADEILQLHEHLRSGCLKRTEQVDSLASLCVLSPYPVTVCGDFNDTPVSYAYHSLLKGKKDAFVESGSGLSSSYSAFWPLLRIDYVLIPEEYRSSQYKVARVPYSDHYPVITTICFD